MSFQKKLNGLIIALSLTAGGLRAQNFQLSQQALDFQTRTELKTDSLALTISNLKNRSLGLKLSIPFRVFKSQPFRIKDSSIVLPAGSSRVVWVYCRIVHNLAQSAHLLITANDTAIPVQNAAVKLQVHGRYSKSYYTQTENLTEEALKTALKNRTGQGYNSLSYDAARGVMYSSLDNKNDSVTCVYTLRKAKFNSTSGASANNFNCEHTFPQGFFSQSLPMRSDMHHLYSTDDAANNSRGNLPFGIAVPPLVATSVNAPSKNGGGKYEPQDGHKGNCARAMMYFVLRYQDYSNFFAPQEQILRNWHSSFPPKPADTLRNAKVFVQQNNRNPFVDYPQFADRIRNLVSTSVSDSSVIWRQSNQSIVLKNTFPSQALSVLVWNEGNRSITVRNIRFALTQYDFAAGSNQNFVLGFNEARSITFFSNDPTEEYFSDTLILETTDPARPVVKIPLLVQNPTAVQHQKYAVSQVFPNPAGPELRIIRQGNTGLCEIELSNAEGKILRQTKAEGEEIIFSTARLKAGLYWITVKGTWGTERFKIIKP